MGKKITRDEFEQRVKEVSNDTIDVSEFDFKGTQSNGLLKCKVCGYKWTTAAYSVLNGHGCRKCYGKRNSDRRMYSIDYVQDRINESGSECEIIGEYTDTKHKCKAKCNICGNIWSPRVSDIMRGHGCPICGLQKQGEQERLSPEEYKNRCIELYGDAYDLSELNYTVMRGCVYPICPRHGKVELSAYQFLHGNGCVKCRLGGNQRKLSLYLKRNGFQIEDEYNKFEWLRVYKNGGKMSFDMFIKEYNIAIEYQGKQHFESVERFGGIENLEITKKRDKKKYELCKENNITLIYFVPKKYEKYMKNKLFFTNRKELLEYLRKITNRSII